MTWTYESGVSTTLARMRFLSGDTDSTDPLLTDEEMNFASGLSGSIHGKAAIAADAIAAKFSRQADKEVGDLRIWASQKAASYKALAKSLRSQGSTGAIPVAGGVLISQKETQELNSDRVTPKFDTNKEKTSSDGIFNYPR